MNKFSLRNVVIALPLMIPLGCAVSNPLEVSRPPVQQAVVSQEKTVSTLHNSLDIPSHKLEDIINANNREFINHRGIKNALSPYGDFIFSVISFHGLLSEEGHLRKDYALEIGSARSYFSHDEIEGVLRSEGIPYASFQAPLPPGEKKEDYVFSIMRRSHQKLLDDAIDARYPNRKERIQQAVDTEFEESVLRASREREEIIKGGNVFLSIHGALDINSNLKHYMDEFNQNSICINEFVQGNEYGVIRLNSPRWSMKLALNQLRGASESQNVIVYYQGHGTESGMWVSSSEFISPKELEASLRSIPGNITLIANCCFSGDFKKYFESVSSPVSVIAASQPGKLVRASDLGNAGYLVQDLVKSGFDIKRFEEIAMDVPQADYYPSVYIAGSRVK